MRAWVFVSLLGFAACGGERAPSGLDEPIRVRGAAFKNAEIPGVPAPEADSGVAAARPEITSLDTASSVVTARQSGKSYAGRASPEAYAVAVRIVGAGTGYWVLPVGGPDPTANNELTWNLTADFGDPLPSGLQTLRFAAIDGDGRAGAWRDVRLCVAGEIPDGLNACDATLPPPAAVISLAWDADVDLDLEVRAPDGKIIDWRHPTTAAPDGGVVDRASLADPSTGALDRNSNADCAIDSIRRESLVWTEAPAPGVYRVYASLFSACGQTATGFRVSALRRESVAEGRFRQTEFFSRDGAVTSYDAHGGATLGTFVGEITLP